MAAVQTHMPGGDTHEIIWRGEPVWKFYTVVHTVGGFSHEVCFCEPIPVESFRWMGRGSEMHAKSLDRFIGFCNEITVDRCVIRFDCAHFQALHPGRQEWVTTGLRHAQLGYSAQDGGRLDVGVLMDLSRCISLLQQLSDDALASCWAQLQKDLGFWEKAKFKIGKGDLAEIVAPSPRATFIKMMVSTSAMLGDCWARIEPRLVGQVQDQHQASLQGQFAGNVQGSESGPIQPTALRDGFAAKVARWEDSQRTFREEYEVWLRSVTPPAQRDELRAEQARRDAEQLAERDERARVAQQERIAAQEQQAAEANSSSPGGRSSSPAQASATAVTSVAVRRGLYTAAAERRWAQSVEREASGASGPSF